MSNNTNNQKFKLELGSRNLEIEIRNLAEKANGNVLVRYGDTLVLATAVMTDIQRPGINFFPLTVDYEERYYAAGKIRGPRYIRRESRPSDEAILTSRLIDRTIRPLFPKELKKEVQVVITVLSWDAENDPDVIGIIAASTALSISDIPWNGPIGAVRVGKSQDKYVLNPTYKERGEERFDITFCGRKDEKDEILINMIEAQGDEFEEKMAIEAIKFGEQDLKRIIDFQKEIIAKIGKEKIKIEPAASEPETDKKIREFLSDKLEKAVFQEKSQSIDVLKKEMEEWVESQYPGMNKKAYAANFFENELEDVFYKNIILKEKRPDGRKIDELRKISCEVGLLPRTHGSGLFMRGQTKSLSILTLGAPGDQQILEGMEIVGKKRFMHHYNFPPYSSGEIKPLRGPGRREIGHGMLAEKALFSVIPSYEEFPYTIRIVSEILSSNGSTSMAATSSSALSLMDAGVPIKRLVTGIALGLVIAKGHTPAEASETDNYKILTDIQGPEDHHGDMDFKVAGTRQGITAIQMDVKIDGITQKILAEALERGRKARNQILDIIEKVIDKPRPQLSQWAPRIYTLQINPEKIREVIGPGGKVINEIIGATGVSIDIEDSGKIIITSEKEESAKKAVEWINNITREVVVGEIFYGKVKRILAFGAFVEILPGQEGLVHISQLAERRVGKVEDIVKINDVIPVKVIGIDDQGRINLSLKEVNHLVNNTNKK